MRVEGKARADRGRRHRQQHQRQHLHGRNRRERAQDGKDGAAKPQSPSAASSLLPDSRCVRGDARQRAPPSLLCPGTRSSSSGWSQLRGRRNDEPVPQVDFGFKLIRNRIPPVKRHLDAAASREKRSSKISSGIMNERHS